MQQSLSAILFPGYRRAVLGLLLLHPEEALHGREIARRTGLDSGAVTRELARPAEAGLLKRETRGNQVLYSADRDSPVFEELASILRKTSAALPLRSIPCAILRSAARAMMALRRRPPE